MERIGAIAICLEGLAFVLLIGILVLSLPEGGMISGLALLHIIIDLTTYGLLAYFIDEKVRRRK
jgi:hypothetical protein